jgi:hypothetical protein
MTAPFRLIRIPIVTALAAFLMVFAPPPEARADAAGAAGAASAAALPLPDAAGLAPPAADATDAAAPRQPRDRKKKKSDDAGDEGSGGDAAKKDDKEQPKEPPFEKLVKGAKELKGLFNVYIKEDEGKHYLELAPEQFDVSYLLNPTLVSGIGQAFIYPADMLPEYLIAFHRAGKTVQVIHRNPLIQADAASTLHGPAAQAVPDAIVGQGKIESQPHPERKSVLVDLGSLFLNDLEGLSLYLRRVLETPYQADRDGSSVALVKAFPDNLDFETVLHLKTPEVKRPLLYAADPRSLLVRFHYSIARLPDTGYRPRLADDRVGHFPTLVKDYSDDRADDPTVRYVQRWHLEKNDPGAALSEPKQPIVFYLEDSIPREYRQAVREGVLGWNPAFEAIGFENALVVKEQPDDPEWDAADVRYSTLRWIVAPNATFAQGPSRANPFTGQLFDADIRFSVDIIRAIRDEYEEFTAPVAHPAAAPPAAGAPWTLRTLAGWTSMLGPFSLETLLAAAGGDAGEAARPVLGAGARPWMSRAAHGYCDYSRGLAHQAALGRSVLAARGALDPEEEERYVHGFIVHVTLHEVGHTLGLRHNFKASGIHPFASLQDRAVTGRVGITGSVMDYTPVNLAPEGRPQADYWQTIIGPYDYWAIEYAYKPIDAASPRDEEPVLDRIAARAPEPLLAYGTDEDTFIGSPRGMDPGSNAYDNSSDLLAYYTARAAMANELFAKLEERFSEPGTRYQKIRRVFGQGIGELVPAAVNVPKYIGGIRHHRDHIGDPGGRLPYDPVPAAEQRAALQYLTREIFGPRAFQFAPRLLNMLAIERLPDMEGQVWTVERNDPPIHTLVLTIQGLPLDRIYHPITLGRLHDLEARYANPADAFTMAETFTAIRRAIWEELDGRRRINSFRRNLQRRHLQILVNLVVQADPAAPEDARTLARADLLALRRGIDALLAATGRPTPAGARLDATTVAHLDETRARINAALEAGLQRQVPGGAAPQGRTAG